ncbi:MAG: protease modulator HflC [Clostridia bacterium]|nr:protease modulator HflC [Clostridia bacterium]
MKRFGLLIGIIVVFLLANSIYVVPETQQVVVTEFGKPVQVQTEPGLYLKKPFINKLNVFSTKALDYDSSPYNIYTADKKSLRVDNYAKWRIVDPLLFLQSLRTETSAQSRLDDIIYSILREELGRYDFVNIIRRDRSSIMEKVTHNANLAMQEYGIEIIDVRIKRADLPEENERAVFNRMISERERIASRYLSEGDEEALKITAEADRQVVELLAQAYREAEMVKAEGDQIAAQIYNKAYSKDPAFYQFYMALNTLKETMSGETTLFLPHDSDLAKYLLQIR